MNKTIGRYVNQHLESHKIHVNVKLGIYKKIISHWIRIQEQFTTAYSIIFQNGNLKKAKEWWGENDGKSVEERETAFKALNISFFVNLI